MDHEDKDQFFSVNNDRYYVKRTAEDTFYLLTEEGKWKYSPALADEFYDILSGYTEITEEAMETVIRERKKPCGREDNFSAKEKNCVFRITCNTGSDWPDTVVYDDDEICLLMTMDDDTNQLRSIECLYANEVEIERYYLRDYTEIEGIRQVGGAYLFGEEDMLVQLNLKKDHLDILFQEYLDATHYFADGRVEYYYDDDMRLLYIKIKNLTAEEYRHFRDLSDAAES